MHLKITTHFFVIILTCGILACGNNKKKRDTKSVNQTDSSSIITDKPSLPLNDSVRTLISNKKIKGQLFDKGIFEVSVKTKNGIENVLVDSIFKFEKIEDYKISFFAKLSELTSSIKYGYLEFDQHSLNGKLEYLTDSLEKISSKSGLQSKVMLITGSTFPRNDYKNVYEMEIVSPYSGKFFTCKLLKEDYLHLDSTGKVIDKAARNDVKKDW